METWSAASTCYYDIFKFGYFGEHAVFHEAKGFFPFLSENVADVGVEACLYVGVEIYELQSGAACNFASKSGFAAAHIPYEKYRLCHVDVIICATKLM